MRATPGKGRHVGSASEVTDNAMVRKKSELDQKESTIEFVAGSAIYHSLRARPG
jgi:hypothetical protein